MESKLQTILADLLLVNIVTFATYASGNAIWSGVWNQCSPPGITSSVAPVLRAKSEIVASRTDAVRNYADAPAPALRQAVEILREQKSG